MKVEITEGEIGISEELLELKLIRREIDFLHVLIERLSKKKAALEFKEKKLKGRMKIV